MFVRGVRTTQPQGPARTNWASKFLNKRAINSVFVGSEIWSKGSISGSVLRRTDSADVSSYSLEGNIGIPAADLGLKPFWTRHTLIKNKSVGTGTSDAAIWYQHSSGGAVRYAIHRTRFTETGIRLVVNATISASSIPIGKGGFSLLTVTNDGVNTKLYVNGRLGATINLSNTLSTIGQRNLIGGCVGEYFYDFVLDEVTPEAEIKSLSDNPWQIFAPDAKSLWTPAAVSVTLPTLVQPSSTTSAGAWTATGAATLHEAINELVPSDTQYISVNSASTTELVLAESAHPGAANQTLAYRASSTQGSTLTVTLKQGATQIMTRTHSLTGVDTLYTQTLTAPEIALITAGPISVTLTTS